MGELLLRLVVALFLGVVLVIPAALIAFIYGLITRRSWSQASHMVGKVAVIIIDGIGLGL